MRIDSHVHTRRCGHGEGDVAEFVSAGRTAGLDVITFTEHLPLPEDLDPAREYAMAPFDLPDYVAEVRAAGVGAPKVLLGMEVDWLPKRTEWAERLLSTAQWDFVLGSVHFLDGWAFDDPALVDSWDAANVDDAWERYFTEVASAAASGMFDAIAHPDLIKKFGHRPSRSVRDLYEMLARTLADAGVAVEVSSAGLRKPCAELYPGQELLAALYRAGVPATIGSDAHRPDEVGVGLDEAAGALASAGYTSVVYFEGRMPKEVAL